MGNWTIVTTAAEDEAITYSYQQSQKGPVTAPPPALGRTATAPEPKAPETIEAYFDRMTHETTVKLMSNLHMKAKNEKMLADMSTIPPENRDAAQSDLDALIVKHGGTVELTKLSYKWSKNTAAPPTVQSIELDKTDANVATVTKITFDYRDASGTDRMAQLMGIKVGTTIRITDPANASTFVEVKTTAAPIQRQGANGFVEIAVSYVSSSGLLAPLDTKPVDATFS